MAEIFQNWEQKFQHVGKCMVAHHIIYAILMYRRSFGTSHRGCTASQHVAGPIEDDYLTED